jgi:hypothetical protein
MEIYEDSAIWRYGNTGDLVIRKSGDLLKLTTG